MKKVMRFMKTNVYYEVWPSVTVTPMGISVKYGHTHGFIGQIGSYPVGTSIKPGHTRWVQRSNPLKPRMYRNFHEKSSTMIQKNDFLNHSKCMKKKVIRFVLNFWINCGYKVMSQVRRTAKSVKIVPETIYPSKIVKNHQKSRFFEVFNRLKCAENETLLSSSAL